MKNRPIIIRKYKKPHIRLNTGAWKIAYADFVTAMMALFLLMWLVNVATEETKKGISEYFTASVISMNSASAGSRVIEGVVSATQFGQSDEEVIDDGEMEHSAKPTSVKNNINADKETQENKEEKKIAIERQQRRESLQQVENTVKAAFNSLKELGQIQHNLMIEQTDYGVRIQIVDTQEQEMFKKGDDTPVKVTETLIGELGKIISQLPNKIDITGHTDSHPYYRKEYGNWELSSDRAHSTRRILEESGVRNEQFSEVHGRADRDPLNKSNPSAPENRRVSITILHTDSQSQVTSLDKVNQKNNNSNMPKIIL